MLISVPEIAERLNATAETLAPDLLPNGKRCGAYWRASGVDDTGRSTSLAVRLSGSTVGHWVDYGGAAAGEQKGDMIDLLQLVRCGGDKKAAVDEAKRLLGIEDSFKPGQRVEISPEEKARRAEAQAARAAARDERQARERAAKARGAVALFLKGVAIDGTPAEGYLLARGIERDGAARHKWPGSLRYHPEVWHRGEQVKCPALLAAIFNADGVQIGTHRIYLARYNGRWQKLRTEGGAAKMVLGNMWGGFVPIHKGASGRSMGKMTPDRWAREAIYVCEGIEDALCIRAVKPEARVLAAISLGNIGAIELPGDAAKAGARLVVVADRDDGEQAQTVLERGIAAQQARGLHVQLVLPPTEVAGRPVKDVNDWVVALKRQAA